ncbi:MAG: STAS domain-containing protein [Spirochaetia bacterium]|nr:STAS domain-containing protein [Spirochaetia bacterium]
MLELNTKLNDEVLIIELEGALDSRTASDFKAWFEERMLDGYKDFVLDFLSLEYLSSRGIGVLSEIHQFLISRGGKMAICHASEEIMRLLKFLKIDQMIKLCSGAKEAVTEIQKMKRNENTGVLEKNLQQPTPMDIGSQEFQEVNNGSNNTATIPVTETENNDSQSNESIPLEKNIEQVQSGARIIYCQNCGRRLRVSKAGKYLCPSCKINFYYNIENNIEN